MWSQWASESSSLSPLNMSLLSRSSRPAVDPTNVLSALQCKMSSIRKQPTRCAGDIRGVLEELKGDSSLVENVLPSVRDITKLSGYPRNVKTRLEQSNLFLASGRFPLQMMKELQNSKLL